MCVCECVCVCVIVCVCLAMRNKGMTLSFYKNIYVFVSLDQSFCVVRETDGRTGREGDEDRVPYWAISSSLYHNMLYYFQGGPTKHFWF